MKQYDIIIIGAGPSGIYASTYAALKGLNVLVVETSEVIGGQPRQLYGHKKVYDFPGHLVTTGEEIIKNLLEQQQNIQKQIKYLLNTTIIKYQYLKNGLISIKLSNQETIKVKAIIIATGNGSLTPNLIDSNLLSKKINSKKISYFVQNFKAYKNQNIVILGGGDSAVEWAGQIAKSKLPKSVSIIHRKPIYRANIKYVKDLKKYQVFEYLDFEICSINQNYLEIKSNINNKLQKIKYDQIIIQYGLKHLKPQIDIWSKLNKIGTKFITNQNQETNEKNIYAIGAATHYKGRPNLMVVGIAEGIIAIKHIADKINPYVQDYITKD